jgi:hypothetical protein
MWGVRDRQIEGGMWIEVGVKTGRSLYTLGLYQIIIMPSSNQTTGIRTAQFDMFFQADKPFNVMYFTTFV